MCHIRTSAVIVSLALFCGSLFADEVHFVNGDRITGKIKQLIDGKLVLESEVAGDLSIDVSKIRSFSSDEPVEIHFADGTVIKQRIESTEPGKIAILSTETLQAQQFELAQITSINPPAKPKAKWTGSISAGFSSTHGNTKAENRSLSADLVRRSEMDRLTAKADYARGEQEDPDTGEDDVTENWWRTRGKYDYFVSKKLYVYGDTRYEKDSIADLDRRVVVGGGGGYQWVESDAMNFSTEGGLASLYEKFENQTDSNTELSVQLGYHFDKKLHEAIKFINDLTYYPSTEKFSDYYLTSTGELRGSITNNMFTNFKVIFDYDATPAVGAGNTDVKYIFGAGWNF